MPTAARTRAKPAALTGVRARTQRAILDAAVRLFARQGIGETAIHEIAAEADLSNGSFYNYFRTREELVEAAGTRLAAELTDEISRMSVNVTDPAERVSIGSRRFMLKAFEDPTWGAAVLRVWANTPLMARRVSDAALSDLRSGRRRGRFRYDDERAAVDLLHGSVLAAMRTLLEGGARADHAVNVARLVLRGLGVPDEEAAAIARRPLPVEAPGPRVGEPRRK